MTGHFLHTAYSPAMLIGGINAVNSTSIDLKPVASISGAGTIEFRGVARCSGGLVWLEE